MKVIVQRVLNASVKVDNEVVNEIKKGYLLLVGIYEDDNKQIVSKVADKISKLRIFSASFLIEVSSKSGFTINIISYLFIISTSFWT